MRVQEKSATERAKRLPLKALVLAPALVAHQRLALRVLRWMCNLVALHGAPHRLLGHTCTMHMHIVHTAHTLLPLFPPRRSTSPSCDALPYFYLSAFYVYTYSYSYFYSYSVATSEAIA